MIGALPDVLFAFDFQGVGVSSQVDGAAYSSHFATDRTDAELRKRGANVDTVLISEVPVIDRTRVTQWSNGCENEAASKSIERWEVTEGPDSRDRDAIRIRETS